jgi:hypothetical protein
MKNAITIRGPVTITYLRGGAVRIEATQKRRPRMHVRGDEFMRLLHQESVRREPTRLRLVGAEGAS